jgi:hypothetical protein
LTPDPFTPGAAFQLKWHVSNLKENKILDECEKE